MFAGTALVSVQQSSTPFITQSPFISNQMAKLYFNSIDSYLQGKAGGGYTTLVTCVDNIRNNGIMKAVFTGLAGNPCGPAARPYLLRLDKVAYEIKALAGHQVYVQPVTGATNRTLSTTNAEVREVFAGLIDRFPESYQGDGAAATQTIVHAQPPNSTYRIDRESLSAAPAPRYWTYRIQAGSPTYGGIEMESNIYFKVVDVRAALIASLNSTLTGHGPARYVRLSAPQWLRDILAADLRAL
ncbi:MAG: hypothetical protein WBY44_11820 [Bryobacteraceae bacterium]